MKATYTFADLLPYIDMVNVECSRCGRKGRYRLSRLIERFGPDTSSRAIVPELTDGCPRRNSVSIQERCDILFPGTAAWFLSKDTTKSD